MRLDPDAAARLIAVQFPELAGRAVRPLDAKGADNHIFRIGSDLCARFPKVAWAAATARREARALPRFSGAPLPVPEVYGLGAAGEGYPHPWSVLSWLPGTPLVESRCEPVRGCDVGDPYDQINTNISNASKCMTARKNINNLCFKGGNRGHQQQVTELGNLIRSCQKAYRQ
ncbi:phosphotransferase [Hyphomonas sp.]|uniref:phosphotransferase n=1 Tax=Hyphomonas sp. TaxID=87 RepID=UPI00391990EE